MNVIMNMRMTVLDLWLMNEFIEMYYCIINEMFFSQNVLQTYYVHAIFW